LYVERRVHRVGALCIQVKIPGDHATSSVVHNGAFNVNVHGLRVLGAFVVCLRRFGAVNVYLQILFVDQQILEVEEILVDLHFDTFDVDHFVCFYTGKQSSSVNDLRLSFSPYLNLPHIEEIEFIHEVLVVELAIDEKPLIDAVLNFRYVNIKRDLRRYDYQIGIFFVVIDRIEEKYVA
jgi:hypothetical protein